VAVVTTEKDWVKLRDFDWRIPVVVARLRVELVGGALIVPGA
jgi:tetraacyldisaccharide-1-P 4'-kinase